MDVKGGHGCSLYGKENSLFVPQKKASNFRFGTTSGNDDRIVI